jgi:hypothetical protein
MIGASACATLHPSIAAGSCGVLRAETDALFRNRQRV